MGKTAKLPNFLIVGATKCGTSSLSKYLQQHPEVFISSIKEPRFISSQFMEFPLNGPRDHEVEAWYVKQFTQYAELFKDATQPAMGEASADTIYYYDQAIPVIREYLGDPKIIIILRDPVKRAFSAYQHLVRDNRESLSFEDALRHEDDRIADNWELIYYYTKAGKYFESVKAFKENFSNVLILFNEDMSSNPDGFFKRVFKFLGVDEDFAISTDLKHNVSGVPSSRLLFQIVARDHWIKSALRPFLRMLIPRHLRTQITHRLIERNLNKLSLAEDTGRDLRSYFREDVSQLQGLLGRDLSDWMGKSH